MAAKHDICGGICAEPCDHDLATRRHELIACSFFEEVSRIVSGRAMNGQDTCLEFDLRGERAKHFALLGGQGRISKFSSRRQIVESAFEQRSVVIAPNGCE